MVWDRKQRWEAILQEKVAVIVQQRLNDPRLGFITVTRVELSRDKRICSVFFTVLGTDSQRRRSERALADAARRVQELLAPTLRMRSMPELRFVYDEAVKRESRLLDLIAEVSEERRAWEQEHGLTEPEDADAASGSEAGADGEDGEDAPDADVVAPDVAEGASLDEPAPEAPRPQDGPGGL